MDDVLPNWMTDGKGLRGDAAPSPQPRIEFPSAQVVNEEPQLAQGSSPVAPVQGIIGSGSTPTPWLVTASPKTGGGYNFTIDKAGISILLSDPTDWTSQLTISNIGTGTTLAWNGGDDLIWIDATGAPIDLTNLSSLTPAIKSLGNGDTFAPGQITDDGGTGTPLVYNQIGFKKVIAAISSDGGSPAKPVIQQLLFSNLALEIGSLNSFTSSVIISACFPYPI